MRHLFAHGCCERGNPNALAIRNENGVADVPCADRCSVAAAKQYDELNRASFAVVATEKIDPVTLIGKPRKPSQSSGRRQ